MTNISKGDPSFTRLKNMDDHDAFLSRITKSLYYSRLPRIDRFSLPVTEFAAELFTEVKGGLSLECLDVEEAGRISRNACVSPCSLVLALLYLERLKDCNPEYLLKVAPSELFLVSLMVASKFLNDDGEEDEVFNMEWAKSGDLTIGEINQLEKEFLGAIDWSVFVKNRDFWERLRRLEKDIAYKEGRKRGWFSYTELTCLMENVQLAAIVHTFVSVSSICLVTYAAGLITLLGSVLVASQLPGTTLVPQQVIQPGNVRITNLTRPQYGSLNSSRIENLESSSDNTKISNDFDLLLSNDLCLNCNILGSKKPSSIEQYTSWEWWLDSVMTWLPEQSKINDNVIVNSIYDKNKRWDRGIMRKYGKNDDSYDTIITTEKLRGKGEYIREVDNLMMEISWKNTLSSDFYVVNNVWQYYATKISLLGPQH
ncbi:protein CNPPD1 [Venturia canescens]|uniref:protein CNPPD1 n=1 Tax=Venturia canescens TaxID=32260 RepID=UPI001C9BD206|nr:protein CNPPD1 [Venturia canescens]